MLGVLSFYDAVKYTVSVSHRVLEVSGVMSGCLDKCTCPDWEIWNTVRERRNFLSSVVSGAMVCTSV